MAISSPKISAPQLRSWQSSRQRVVTMLTPAQNFLVRCGVLSKFFTSNTTASRDSAAALRRYPATRGPSTVTPQRRTDPLQKHLHRHPPSRVLSTETPRRHPASRGHSIVTPRQMSGGQSSGAQKSYIWRGAHAREGRCPRGRCPGTVSYTHLTLPTNREV